MESTSSSVQSHLIDHSSDTFSESSQETKSKRIRPEERGEKNGDGTRFSLPDHNRMNIMERERENGTTTWTVELIIIFSFFLFTWNAIDL